MGSDAKMTGAVSSERLESEQVFVGWKITIIYHHFSYCIHDSRWTGKGALILNGRAPIDKWGWISKEILVE